MLLSVVRGIIWMFKWLKSIFLIQKISVTSTLPLLVSWLKWFHSVLLAAIVVKIGPLFFSIVWPFLVEMFYEPNTSFYNFYTFTTWGILIFKFIFIVFSSSIQEGSFHNPYLCKRVPLFLLFLCSFFFFFFLVGVGVGGRDCPTRKQGESNCRPNP